MSFKGVPISNLRQFAITFTPHPPNQNKTTPSDAPFLHTTFLSSPEGYYHSANTLPRPQTLADAEKTLATMAESLLAVMICLPPSPSAATTEPVPIGHLTLEASPKARHHRTCGLGIIIAPSYQGKRYGSEAILWAVDWAFKSANMHSVRIAAFGYNEGAVRLYDRLGFVREGSMREALWWEGRWWDRVLWSVLEGEWAERRKKTVTGEEVTR